MEFPFPPSREDILIRLDGLIEGSFDRDAVAAWAWQWVDGRGHEVFDRAVWEALNELAGADSPNIDRATYLFHEVDFRAWKRSLLDAP